MHAKIISPRAVNQEMMKQAETGLFSFQGQRLRGFQMGDPLRATIHIDAFDDQDRQF
jgi:hypothetical protein